MDTDTTVPRDEFSTTIRGLAGHPGSVTKQSLVETTDFYGNHVTWIVRTIRVDGRDTILIQREDGREPVRLVLPPDVTEALSRHRSGAVKVMRRRGATQAAATRAARGIVPNVTAMRAAKLAKAGKKGKG